MREVEEETGIRGRVLAPLGTIDFWFVAEDRRVHKTVHHFLLEAEGGELSDDDIEVVEVAWVALADVAGAARLRRRATPAREGRLPPRTRPRRTDGESAPTATPAPADDPEPRGAPARRRDRARVGRCRARSACLSRSPVPRPRLVRAPTPCAPPTPPGACPSASRRCRPRSRPPTTRSSSPDPWPTRRRPPPDPSSYACGCRPRPVRNRSEIAGILTGLGGPDGRHGRGHAHRRRGQPRARSEGDVPDHRARVRPAAAGPYGRGRRARRRVARRPRRRRPGRGADRLHPHVPALVPGRRSGGTDPGRVAVPAHHGSVPCRRQRLPRRPSRDGGVGQGPPRAPARRRRGRPERGQLGGRPGAAAVAEGHERRLRRTPAGRHRDAGHRWRRRRARSSAGWHP